MQGMVDRIQRWLQQMSPIILYILYSAKCVCPVMSIQEKANTGAIANTSMLVT
jgi:hypothetical protein